ncbi:Sec1 family superfamily [Metarhizium guizhouense ARSEF 977]|uniref:Sec1 family superfamily n=1 Tax=Metarhizium guizhouense (strain ARSEF 977) TaxID=1276136 RepID=A0A0B4GHG5_METGA|nr:Sec1 family superfamily [Metarhizium guizhouense ARSEF 977]
MGFSATQEHHDAILQEIQNRTQADVRPETAPFFPLCVPDNSTRANVWRFEQWKYLIVDEASKKLIYNSVKEDDILSSSIATIERIEERREPNPGMEAIYFLTPEPHIVDCLLADFDRRLYGRAFLIWTSLLDPKLSRKINEFPGVGSLMVQPQQQRPGSRPVANPKTLLIDFYPRESHLISFKDPWSFPILYHPACNNLIPKHMRILAQRIAGVCITLGEYPKVRYYRPTAAFHEASVLSSHLARFVQEELDVYAEWHKNEYPPPSNRPPSTLIITDRSMDLMAPLLHEFTYQAMAHDLLPIKDGDKVTFHTKVNAGTKDEKEEDVELCDDDKIWVDSRHRHMKDTIDKLMGDFQKFIDENPHFTKDTENGGAPTLNTMREMVAGLPQFQQMKSAYALHLNMAQECMNAFQNHKLPDLASAEQTMSTGLDEDYRKPKNILETVVGLLDDEAVLPADRLRLIVIYILYRGGVITEDVKKLLLHAALPPQDGEVITNMELLGGKTSYTLKEPRQQPPPLFPKDPKAFQPSEDYALSRFEPVLKPVLDELTKGTLDQTIFPYVKPPSDPNEDLLAAQGGSLRAGRPNWAAAGRRPPENRQRIIVFMAGGATYSESRVCYEVGREKSRDIVLATSHMLTPKLFIRQVADLSRDKRQLDIPMERPKPRAPAHLFERPPPPPSQQLNPGAGPRMAGNPGRAPPPTGGLPGRPVAPPGGAPLPPVPPAPPVSSMSNLNLNSNGAPPAKPQGKPPKEKKKRNFLGMKK